MNKLKTLEGGYRKLSEMCVGNMAVVSARVSLDFGLRIDTFFKSISLFWGLQHIRE